MLELFSIVGSMRVQKSQEYDGWYFSTAALKAKHAVIIANSSTKVQVPKNQKESAWEPQSDNSDDLYHGAFHAILKEWPDLGLGMLRLNSYS